MKKNDLINLKKLLNMNKNLSIRLDELGEAPKTKRNNFEIIYTKNDNLRLIKMNYRQLIQYTQSWIYNRSLSLEKVNDLYDEISKNSANISWTLYAFYDNSKNEIKLLDGQHRREAIIKYLELNDLNMSNNDDIFIWLYYIENEEINEEEIIELFIKLNKNEPIDFSQIPSKRKMNLFKLIKNEPLFKKAIRQNPNTMVAYSPYISQKQIKNIIDIILNKYPLLSNEDILQKMKEMNNKISIMARIDNVEEQLFNKKMTKNDKEIIEECFEIKFYLNIKKSIYDNFKWIDELIQ